MCIAQLLPERCKYAGLLTSTYERQSLNSSGIDAAQQTTKLSSLTVCDDMLFPKVRSILRFHILRDHVLSSAAI